MTWDEPPYYDLAFGVEKGRRYHARLRDHYQRVHDGIKAANVFCASGVFFAANGANPTLTSLLAGLIALGSLLDLVFGFDKKARAHHDLSGRFSDLAAELEKSPATGESLGKMKAKRLRVEKDEPSVKRLVEMWAHSETARARGVAEDQLIPLSPWQKRLGCFMTFGTDRLEKWNAQRSKL